MKKISSLKNIAYVLLTFLCFMLFLGVKPSEVMAAEGDIDVFVEIEGSDKEKNINEISGLTGMSFDSTNNILTLNNYEGGALIVKSRDEKSKNLEVKIVGNNTLKSNDLFYGNDLLLFENINVTFTGNGKLYLNLEKPNGKQMYFRQGGEGSITIDGPTINMNNCRGYLYTKGDFTMKSGTLNISRFPIVRKGSDYTEFDYYHAIGIDGHFLALGGNININYIYPSGYTNVKEINDNIEAIRCDYLPVIKDCKMNLTLPDELQENVYLLKDTSITVKIVNEYKQALPIDQVGKIDGLTWDKDNLCLTLNGYNGGNIQIDSKYIADIEVKVIGDNTVNEMFGYSLFYFGKNNIRMTGSGTINFVNKLCDVTNIIYGYGGEDKVDFILDGPTLNYTKESKGFDYGFISYSNIEMISGTINVEIIPNYQSHSDSFEYACCLYAAGGGIDISGGTIIADYVPHEGNTVFNSLITISTDNYAYRKSPVINTSNCVIVVAGRGAIVDNDAVFRNRIKSEKTDWLNIGNNTIIIFADEIKNAVPIDINLFKGELSESTFVYDGKKKEPKVKVGGLVEGVDFTVTYSDNVNVGTGSVTVTGKGFYKGTMKLTFEIVPNPKASDIIDGPKNGSTVKDKKYVYKVIKQGNTDGSVIGELEVIGLKKKSLKQIKIAANVKIKGVTYKVTSVGANAFKGNKKITKAIIGKNVVNIGNNAFANCKKLKQVTINSKKLKKIGKGAFAKDKKLNKIIIKSNKLSKVGKNFVKGTSKKLVIKVPKKKKTKYAKKFVNAGFKGKVK